MDIDVLFCNFRGPANYVQLLVNADAKPNMSPVIERLHLYEKPVFRPRDSASILMWSGFQLHPINLFRENALEILAGSLWR
jgi:hypothetical protein